MPLTTCRFSCASLSRRRHAAGSGAAAIRADARASIVHLPCNIAQLVAQQYLVGTLPGRFGQLRKCADVLQLLAQRHGCEVLPVCLRQRPLQPEISYGASAMPAANAVQIGL